jgi:hypothetical protein
MQPTAQAVGVKRQKTASPRGAKETAERDSLMNRAPQSKDLVLPRDRPRLNKEFVCGDSRLRLSVERSSTRFERR